MRVMRLGNRKIMFFILVLILVFFYGFIRNATNLRTEIKSGLNKYFASSVGEHDEILKRFYERRKNWKTSNLGTILFKNVSHEYFGHKVKNRTFVVLFWDQWDWLKNRHVYGYGFSKNDRLPNVLNDCTVKNCVFYGDDKFLDSADAVVVHTQRKTFPIVKKRNPKQRWIFLNDESPYNVFSLANTTTNVTWNDFSNVFNWTMTYRSDSDIPVPYGRTVPLVKPISLKTTEPENVLNQIVPYWKEKIFKDRTMIIMSNCVKNRMNFLRGLQNFIEVDIIGECADKKENKKKCPGHFKKDCMLPSQYIFYIVIENSKCRQYITEKVFHHAYAKGSIPVIMGPSLEDCQDLLPPDSYLHVENYKNIEELVNHMLEISKDYEKILFYHEWRLHFSILNEHGYLNTKSCHLCRICEALNYNDVVTKIYSKSDLDLFFNANLLCDLKYVSEKTY